VVTNPRISAGSTVAFVGLASPGSLENKRRGSR